MYSMTAALLLREFAILICTHLCEVVMQKIVTCTCEHELVLKAAPIYLTTYVTMCIFEFKGFIYFIILLTDKRSLK